MITQEKRMILFLTVCIGSRLLLVYIAKNINNELLKYMGYLLLLPAIGFIYIYLSGIRNTGTGAFGQKIWWNNLRPIHALLYLLFSYNAINGNNTAWKYLFIDVLIGLTNFLNQYF
jgi:hypothetical protein